MQVELAQLEYTLPRLTRMWTHLEKFRGGIGMRGPGETQLETDRRLINHRIKLLKERLSHVQQNRAVQRQSRAGAFKASIVGLHERGQVVDPARHDGQHRRPRRGPALRHARSAHARGGPRRERARAAHRHGRLHPQAAAPSRRVVPRHARGDARRRPPAARRGCEPSALGGAAPRRGPGAARPRPRTSSPCCSCSTRRICSTRQRCCISRSACSASCRARSSSTRRRTRRSTRCGARCGTPCARGVPSRRSGCRRRTGGCWPRSTRMARSWTSARKGDQLVVRARLPERLRGRLEQAGARITTAV